MLVLGRNFGQSIAIGEDIFIKIVKGQGSDCRLAIQAPPHLRILRGEMLDNPDFELPGEQSAQFPHGLK